MIIDEFLYALGFKVDDSGAKTFVSALGGVDKASQHTTKSMLHAVTAGTLLAHGLEKGGEMLRELGHSFLENSEHIENARVTMEALYSTAAEGDQKFKWLWDFAQKNPVMGMDAATEIFMALKNNGIDPTTESMKAFGDAASAVPSVAKLIPQGIAELIEGRYQAGGVLAPLINLHGAGKNRVYEGSYVDKAGIKQSVKLDFNNAEQATNQFVQILKNRFGGSMEAHAKTWFGLTQRMKSDWLSFTQLIMGGGVFDELKMQLASLLEQWEAFTKTDDFRRMMRNAAEIGSEVVAVLGQVASALGGIIELIGNLSGAGSELITTGFFALLLSGKIGGTIAFLIELYKKLAAGQKLINILALANPWGIVIAAVAALAIGIGVLIKKWTDFRNGILDDGWLKDFFMLAGKMMAKFSAGWMYYIDLIKIKYLEFLDVIGKASKKDLEELKQLQKETAGGRSEMEKNAVADFIKGQTINQRRADEVATVARAHPGWTTGQDLGWIKENKPAEFLEFFMKHKVEMSPYPTPLRSSPAVQEMAKQDAAPHITNITLSGVSINADRPEEFVEALRKISSDHQAATLNQQNGSRKMG